MSNSICHYRREENPKPILPKCRYNLACYSFEREHRFGFYHDTFGADNNARLNFLIKASEYGYNKEGSKHYLWEQFACDLSAESDYYRNFLIYVYGYVIENPKDFDALMAIGQAFMTLEENAITGINYLNRAFLMWSFKFLTLRDLNKFIGENISRGVLYSRYDIHFGNIVKLAKNNKGSLLEGLDERGIKTLYSEFMLTDKHRIYGQQREILGLERKLMEFQKGFGSSIDPLTISNTGLTAITVKLIERGGYSGEFKSGHLM
jgi:hypothetical protein